MKNYFHELKNHWKNKEFVISTLIGIIFLLLSLFVNDSASEYATETAGANVRDLIISNIPTFNVSFIVNEVAFAFSVFVLVVILLKPRLIPFTLKSVALFVLIRSAFITLTHLGPFPDHSYINQNAFFGPFNLGSDFFFSGHTGLPYLVALVNWKNRTVRNVSLAASVLFGVSVLLGHLHYSIDVFAAFFITYTIFHLAQKFFAKDYRLASSSEA